MRRAGLVLAGDIGGTNTRLALFEPGSRRPVAAAREASAEHPSLESIVERFLAGAPGPVAAAAFGVAGPVLGGRAEITNLTWTVDATALAGRLRLDRVALVNDLVATATAIPLLDGRQVHPLDRARAVAGGTIGVVAPGTGLGEAFLIWDGSRYRPHASEGGHASFAPRNDTEAELLRWLWDRYDHVSYERVCSGTGIPNIYGFFASRHPDEVSPTVAAAVAEAADATPVIVDAALDPTSPDPVCRRTLEAFVSILGAETGNLALKLLATGGMYLTGGIPPRIVPLLDSPLFRATYSHKGRFGDVVAAIPVRVVLDPAVALLGAAAIALEQLGSDN